MKLVEPGCDEGAARVETIRQPNNRLDREFSDVRTVVSTRPARWRSLVGSTNFGQDKAG